MITQEYADALREFNPSHDALGQAEGAAAELDEIRNQLDAERKDRESKLKKEQKCEFPRGRWKGIYFRKKKELPQNEQSIEKHPTPYLLADRL